MYTDELHAVLEEAGLSPYQADAYVALLNLGSASASELATTSEVPQPRIYDVLRALEDEGYATVYDRDRLYARANDPAQALSGLRGAINRYETAIEEIETRYQTPEVEDGDVTLVRRYRTVFEHAVQAIEAATDHIQLATTPSQFTKLKSELQAAHERDIHIQLSLHFPPDEELSIEHMEFEGVCTEVRHRDLRGPFVLLVDRQRVCYATENYLSDEYGLLIDDYSTAYVFHWYFLTRLWELYETVYSDRDEQLPYSIVEITACVQELEPILNTGAVVYGRVVGEFVRTGRKCEFSGRFTSTEYTGSSANDSPPSLLALAAETRIQFETNEDSYVVGGRGAYTEDIAARRFIIERIDDASTNVEDE